MIEDQGIPFLIPLVVFCRTDDQTGPGRARFAEFFLDGDVGIPVKIEADKSQLFINCETALSTHNNAFRSYV
jgi:hypothetical protein